MKERIKSNIFGIISFALALLAYIWQLFDIMSLGQQQRTMQEHGFVELTIYIPNSGIILLIMLAIIFSIIGLKKDKKGKKFAILGLVMSLFYFFSFYFPFWLIF